MTFSGPQNPMEMLMLMYVFRPGAHLERNREISRFRIFPNVSIFSFSRAVKECLALGTSRRAPAHRFWKTKTSNKKNENNKSDLKNWKFSDFFENWPLENFRCFSPFFFDCLQIFSFCFQISRFFWSEVAQFRAWSFAPNRVQKYWKLIEKS